MKTIVQHIEYLLTCHDCVVVPGWGAWVVQHVSARMAGRACFAPPSRWLSFNASLTHNDGMLAHSLMRADGCTYDEAMRRINAQVGEWRNALQQHGSVGVGSIGRVERNSDASLLFYECDNSVANARFAMLPTLDITPLSDLKDENADEEYFPIHHHTTQSFVQQFAKVAASIAAIVVMLLFISTPIDNNPAQSDYASVVMAEFFAGAPAVMGNDAVTEEPQSESAMTLVVATAPAVAEPAPAIAEPQTQATVAAAQEPTRTPRYILVVGSLPSQRLAEKQVAEFRAQGVTTPIYIYNNDGKYRLYIDGYDTLQEAQARVNAVLARENNPFAGIWVCRTR